MAPGDWPPHCALPKILGVFSQVAGVYVVDLGAAHHQNRLIVHYLGYCERGKCSFAVLPDWTECGRSSFPLSKLPWHSCYNAPGIQGSRHIRMYRLCYTKHPSLMEWAEKGKRKGEKALWLSFHLAWPYSKGCFLKCVPWAGFLHHTGLYLPKFSLRKGVRFQFLLPRSRPEFQNIMKPLLEFISLAGSIRYDIDSTLDLYFCLTSWERKGSSFCQQLLHVRCGETTFPSIYSSNSFWILLHMTSSKDESFFADL